MSSFDTEAYINNYIGYTRIKRLLFVVDKTSDPQVQLDGIRLLFEELKRSRNVTLYRELVEKLGLKFGIPLDEGWVRSTEQSSAKRQEKLEIELNTYNTNMIKESSRMGCNDLGDFLCEVGDFAGALKKYMRSRDYCTTTKHVLQVCANVVKVCLYMGNYQLAMQYLVKAEQTGDGGDLAMSGKLDCARALCDLDQKRYHSVASRLVRISPDHVSAYTEIMSAQDIAIYGGLCALASFTRKELKNEVIDNPIFKQYLELTPELRELIQNFYQSKYTSCMQYLQSVRGELLLDMYLADHVDTLYERIRNKALIQYVSPFATVDLNRMAAAFGMPSEVAQLEKDVAKLIMDGAIKARIDSHNKILYTRKVDERQNTYQKVLEVGDDFSTETENLLLRINLLRNNYVIKPQHRGGHDHPGLAAMMGMGDMHFRKRK